MAGTGMPGPPPEKDQVGNKMDVWMDGGMTGGTVVSQQKGERFDSVPVHMLKCP